MCSFVLSLFIRAYPRHPRLDSFWYVRLFLKNDACGMLKSSMIVMCLATLIDGAQHAYPQQHSRSGEGSTAKRITIEGLITAAPLPDGYEFGRRDVKQGDKLLGHKLTLTKEGAVSKVIVSVDRRKIATRADMVRAADTYIYGIVQSFRAAGLKPVAREIPEIDEHDFKKRLIVKLVYNDPADGSRLLVQIQIFFADHGHTVLVVSDDEEEHAMLTKWAGSVRGR